MSNNVRNFKVTLITQGPVHIGNGKSYGKKDYFIDKGQTIVLNVPVFVSKLNDSQLDLYCQFLTEPGNLKYFLRDNQDIKKVALNSALYRSDTRVEKAHGVAECIKDVDGRPYIPGSSLKGVIRTALLEHIIRSNPQKYAALYANSKQLARSGSKDADAQINKVAFWLAHLDPNGPSAIDDIMRYVSVSDSEPLEKNDLVFAQKYDQFCKNDRQGKDGNTLNVYRESIKPGIKIELTMSIDTRIDTYLSSIAPGFLLDQNGLEKIFQESYQLYKDRFESKYKDITKSNCSSGSDRQQIQTRTQSNRCLHIGTNGPCRNQSLPGSNYCRLHQDDAKMAVNRAAVDLTCFIGGGVGFSNKTIENALFEKDQESVKEVSTILGSQFPKNHRHWQDPQLGVSPHTLKLAYVDNKPYPMGKCTMRIEELS